MGHGCGGGRGSGQGIAVATVQLRVRGGHQHRKVKAVDARTVESIVSEGCGLVRGDGGGEALFWTRLICVRVLAVAMTIAGS